MNPDRVTAGSPDAANAAVGTPIFSQFQVVFDRPVAFDEGYTLQSCPGVTARACRPRQDLSSPAYGQQRSAPPPDLRLRRRPDRHLRGDGGGTLHLVSADASGNVLSDTPESSLPAAQAQAITNLKQQIPGLLPPHILTGSERAQVFSELTLITGHVLETGAYSNPADVFNASDVQVYYQQNTYDASGNLQNSTWVPVPVGSIVAQNPDSQGEATTFLVKLAQDQTAVGVYTYVINPALKSWIRTYNYATQSTTVPASTGVSMDQNANGTGGEPTTSNTDGNFYVESLGDAYYMPTPTYSTTAGLGTTPAFPANPYTKDTVPILIPGPYITRTYTNTGGTVALNTSVTDLYVQFDRFVDISTFIDKPGNTTDQILRIMGPTGDITASLLPYATVTAQDPDGSGSASLFKIHFDLSNPSVPADVARMLSYSGTYTVQIASGVKTKPVGTAPAYGMDTNFNAGLDVLRGTASTTSTTSTVTTTAVGASGVGPVPDVNIDPVTKQVTGPGTQTFNLNVGSNFNLPATAINGKSPLTVTFSIETQSDSDLTGILVAHQRLLGRAVQPGALHQRQRQLHQHHPRRPGEHQHPERRCPVLQRHLQAPRRRHPQRLDPHDSGPRPDQAGRQPDRPGRRPGNLLRPVELQGRR